MVPVQRAGAEVTATFWAKPQADRGGSWIVRYKTRRCFVDAKEAVSTAVGTMKRKKQNGPGEARKIASSQVSAKREGIMSLCVVCSALRVLQQPSCYKKFAVRL